MTNIFHLRLTNSHSQAVQLILEPWGDVRELAAQASVEIAFEVQDEKGIDAPEIQWDASSITVYCGRHGSFEVTSSPDSANGFHASLAKTEIA